MSTVRSSTCVVAFLVVAGSTSAEKPVVSGLFPAGGKRGSEFTVKAIGKLEPWPVAAICDEDRITFVAHEKEKGAYQVKIPADVEAGPVLLRFFNEEGATLPRQFVVGDLEERAESGSGAMAIPTGAIPFTINGRLESGGTVDRFSLELKAGEVVAAEVVAYALDSPLDPLLHLRGPRGEQLAFNHDGTRNGLDPRLVFRAPADGTYELQLAAFAYPPRADVRFTGGESAVYRLTLRGSPPVIELPDPRESEEDPQRVALPATISGTIEPAGDVDRYLFSGEKGETLRFEVVAAEIGSWMDPVLVIRDAAGKELKREDDIDRKTHHDVALDWTVPSDGEFTAEVFDLNGAGGREIAYRFRLSKPPPQVEATLAGGVLAIAPGKKQEVGVKVARKYGFAGELEVTVDGLPAGITAAPAAVNEKGEAKVVFEAAGDAACANVPLTFRVGGKGKPEGGVRCRIDFKGTNADAGDLLLDFTERGWLTVLKPKEP